MNRLQGRSLLALLLVLAAAAGVRGQSTNPPNSQQRLAAAPGTSIRFAGRRSDQGNQPAAPQLELPPAQPEALPPPRRPEIHLGGNDVPTMWMEPLGLPQLESLAESYNPILQRDMARVASARGLAIQAGLYPNPRFDSNNPEFVIADNSTFNAGCMQEIVVKGKLKLDRAAAEQVVRQADITFHQNRLALLTAVRQQYFTVLAAQRRVQILSEMSNIAGQALDTGKKLERAQETSHLDTLLLTNDFSQIQANLRRAQILLDGERKQLAAVVGAPGIELAPIVGDLSARRPDFDEELVRQYAITASTIIQIARAEIARDQILLRRAQVEAYPNVTVGPAAQWGNQPGNDQFWLTITFPIPLWDKNQGNIRAAAANIRDAQASLRTAQNDQLQQVADALSHYQASRQLVDQYEAEILPNLRQTLRLAQEGYTKGVFDFNRYLQAQRTVVETNLNYLDALEEVWTTAAKISGLLQLERLP